MAFFPNMNLPELESPNTTRFFMLDAAVVATLAKSASILNVNILVDKGEKKCRERKKEMHWTFPLPQLIRTRLN